ncbi:MAG: ComF family protein [Patescibacteria group bacterium]
MGLLDLIFPRYCVNCKKYGDYLCPNCFSRLSFDTKNICLVCTKPSYDGLTHPKCVGKYRIDGSFTGIVFNHISKKLIYQFKYKPHLSNLSSFLVDLLYESLIQNEQFNRVLKQVQDDIIFVPVPLSTGKLRKRGYNQAGILAKGLAKKFGLETIDGLIRVKETRSQVGLNKEERRDNIADAFSLKKQYKYYIKHKNIVLVDDVLTTGATMSEAAKILKKSGAKKVFAIAFAKED